MTIGDKTTGDMMTGNTMIEGTMIGGIMKETTMIIVMIGTNLVFHNKICTCHLIALIFQPFHH